MWGFLKHISSTGNLNNTVSLNRNYKLSVKHCTKRALQPVNIPFVHLGMNIRDICIPRRWPWWGCLIFQLHVGSISAGLQGAAEIHRVMRAWAKDLPGSCCCDHTVSRPVRCDGLPQTCTPHPASCLLSSQACRVLLEGVPGDSRGSVLWRAVHPAPLCILPGQNPPELPQWDRFPQGSWPQRWWGCPHQPGAGHHLEAALWELFLPWDIVFMGLRVQGFFLKCSLYNKQLQQRFQ